MNSTLPRALAPPSDPPTSALPPLPAPKTRKSLPSPTATRLPSAPQTPTKLRTPSSKTALPVPTLQTSSTSAVPTLKHIASQPSDASSEKSGDKTVRRSISIAAFPQPPKSSSRIGKPSGRPSLGASLITTNLGSLKTSAGDSATPTTPVSSADSAKPKKLKRSLGSAALGAAYASTPSLLNGSGDSVAVSAGSASPSAGAFLNPPSPIHSRSSSAQDSYSTQATQFEEDEVPRRGREENQDGSDKSSLSGKEAKGNVIVGVRVKPDTGGDMKSEGEWMVDGRRSLIAFRGKEGGDYYYGQSGQSVGNSKTD